MIGRSADDANDTGKRRHLGRCARKVARALTFCCALHAAASGRTEERPELLTFRSSPGITEVTSVNRHRQLIGRREVVAPGGMLMNGFVRVGENVHDAPIPDTFTHIELSVLSDSGWIAGYATRPIGHPVSSMQALLLHVESREVVILPLPEGMRDACALDVSADGRRVSGYAIGRDPPRLLPVIWTLTDDGWKSQKLPCPIEYNPLIVSARVVLSDDGRKAAASVVTRVDELERRDYALFRWTIAEDGTSQAVTIVPYAVHLADLNDRGQLAGRVLLRGKKRPFFYDPITGAKELPIPETAEHVYVTDLNQAGDAVGIAEDPRGPDGSSHAVFWIDGQLKAMTFGFEVGGSTALTITDERLVGGSLQRVQPPDAADAKGNAPEEATGPDLFPTEAYLLQLR